MAAPHEADLWVSQHNELQAELAAAREECARCHRALDALEAEEAGGGGGGLEADLSPHHKRTRLGALAERSGWISVAATVGGIGTCHHFFDVAGHMPIL